MEAIQQGFREPLSQAPHDYQKFAIYIFESPGDRSRKSFG
jgi:hypothetical protein